MGCRAAIEFPPSPELPSEGAMVVLRLLPLAVPPMSVGEAEARVAGGPPATLLWNLTGREQVGQTVAFSVTADSAVLAVRQAAMVCTHFRWSPMVQELSEQEVTLLVQQGLPLPEGLTDLVRRDLPGDGGDPTRDLFRFCAEVWTWMDDQGIRDAWTTMLAVARSPEDQKAALLAALPPALRLGPDPAGNYRGACGARRTPGPALLGPPCTTGGRCLHTASGVCWRRWSIDPDQPPVELDGVALPGTVELEEEQQFQAALGPAFPTAAVDFARAEVAGVEEELPVTESALPVPEQLVAAEVLLHPASPVTPVTPVKASGKKGRARVAEAPPEQ